MNNYQAANDYMAPRAIKKEDFAPSIDDFIEDRTKQINQLIVESRTLFKGTAEYAENEAKRRQLARERSSARRLNARYFNVPKPESASSTSESDADDGMNMEQIPAGKTKEQIEAEDDKKRQEEEAYQKRVNEYWEQKRQTEQGQREGNERQQEKSPTSYHFEGGLVDGETTITVGQEIPDDWFESRTSGDRTGSGFGVDFCATATNRKLSVPSFRHRTWKSF